MEAIEYKGYTIQEDYSLYGNKPEYKFYPTDEGEQHDADGDSEGYRYTGNCKWAYSLDEAKLLIDEIIPFKVIVEKKVYRIRHYTVTPFTWFADAVRFAAQTNGEIVPNIQSI